MGSIINKTKIEASITDQELKKLKILENKILDDLVYVCEKNNIKCFLFAGTLLGAARHSGFIPWDDDIDTLVDIKEFKRIPELVEKEFPNKYFFSGVCSGGERDPFNGMKMMLKGTKLVEEFTVGYPIQRGVDIDIFPLCSCPKSHCFHKLREKRLRIMCSICTIKYERKFHVNNLMSSENKKVRNFQRFRRFLSLFFFWRSYDGWIKKRDKYWLKTYKKSNKCSIHFFGSSVGLTYDDIFPGTKLKFENKDYLVPSDYKKCLLCHYGSSFMELPPMNQRVIRPFKEIVFNEDSNG